MHVCSPASFMLGSNGIDAFVLCLVLQPAPHPPMYYGAFDPDGHRLVLSCELAPCRASSSVIVMSHQQARLDVHGKLSVP